jgi:alginate O-acetyltransferase complex protein AlgJ
LKCHNKSNVVLVVVFCTLVILPVADMLFKLDSFPHLNENRELSPLPVFRLGLAEIAGFPVAFQAYFNDHFGFRNTLIRLNYLIKQKLLGVSPSMQVNIGQQGWLYYTGEGSVDN